MSVAEFRRRYETRFEFYATADAEAVTHVTISQRYQHRLAFEEPFRKLQLGANALLEEGRNNFIYPWLSPLILNGTFQSLYVEPIPWTAEHLRKKLAQAVIGGRHDEVLNVAVCKEDLQNASFYVLDDAAFEDPRVLQRWGGTDNVAALRRFCSEGASLDREVLVAGLRAYHPSPELLVPYVTDIPVRCLTLPSVLGEFGVRPASVDALVIDVEGLELEVLRTMLNMASLRPALVAFEVFEHNFQDAERTMRELLPLMQALVDLGYDIHQRFELMVALAR